MKQTWLVPQDGSEVALRAIDWVIQSSALMKETPHVHLLNVQPSLPRDIGRFINSETIRDFHRDTGMAALTEAKARLEGAGLSAELHVLVGETGPNIVEFAVHHGCAQIVIGTHGHSGLTGTLLGSIAMRVVHLAKVPVVLIH
jgi:nucleotide-binding universal stress UspA family protein